MATEQTFVAQASVHQPGKVFVAWLEDDSDGDCDGTVKGQIYLTIDAARELVRCVQNAIEQAERELDHAKLEEANKVGKKDLAELAAKEKEMAKQDFKKGTLDALTERIRKMEKQEKLADAVSITQNPIQKPATQELYPTQEPMNQ